VSADGVVTGQETEASHRLLPLVVAWPGAKYRDVNPYGHLLYSAMSGKAGVVEFTPREILRSRPADVFHIHWPDAVMTASSLRSAFRLGRLLACFQISRFRGTAVIWTVHNVRPHEVLHPFLDRLLWKGVLRYVQGFIHLTPSSVNQFLEVFPDAASRPHQVIRHGPYDRSPVHVSADEIDASLNPPRQRRKPLVLWFGMLRTYKGVESLVEICVADSDRGFDLVIAGLPKDQGLAQFCDETARNSSGIYTLLEQLSEPQLEGLLEMADLVCLPYTKVHNSGCAFRAISSRVPVLAPRAPGLEDLEAEVGAAWLNLYEGDLNAVKIKDALIKNEDGAGGDPWHRLGWSDLADQTLDFYRTVADRVPRGGRLALRKTPSR